MLVHLRADLLSRVKGRLSLENVLTVLLGAACALMMTIPLPGVLIGSAVMLLTGISLVAFVRARSESAPFSPSPAHLLLMFFFK